MAGQPSLAPAIMGQHSPVGDIDELSFYLSKFSQLTFLYNSLYIIVSDGSRLGGGLEMAFLPLGEGVAGERDDN